MTGPSQPPVGYANPPAKQRFKKGKSGNPRVRPRKQEELWDLLNRALGRKVKVQGSEVPIPMREALIRKLRELALAGDRRALEMQRRILAEASAAEVKQFDPIRKRDELLKRIRKKLEEDGASNV